VGTANHQSRITNQKSLALALILVALLGIHLFTLHRWWFPAPAAMDAEAIDHQFSIALWLLGGLFVAGQIVLALVIFRTRRKSHAAYSLGSVRWEVTWTLAITALFFWFNITGERLWSEIKIHQPSANDSIQVEVTGVQFQWYFRYPGPDQRWGRTDPRLAKPNEGNPLGIDPDDPAGGDDVVSTSLVVPVDRDVDLTLRAQDVIHSVFIPAMRFKQDAVPGMDIHAHLKPLRIGTFEIVCSQLCGLGHYRMRAEMRVVSDEDFNQWLKKRETDLAANPRHAPRQAGAGGTGRRE
jgi:cytochrome c oxidase subunit II